jgi:hypothetical protein
MLVGILARLVHISDAARMSRIADIIPISSRRPPTAKVQRGEPLVGSTVGAGWIVLAALLSLMMVGVGLSFADGLSHNSVAHLPTANRAAIFRRSYDDLRETCGLPEAAQGAVQEHCRSSASFVLMFPECDHSCQQAARALLPRARR